MFNTVPIHAGEKYEYLEAYRQIIATQDCLEMWFFKVILLGAPGLGKTTARRRLTGEIDDISSSGEEVQPSTGTVESGHSVVIRNLSSTTALITPSEWLVVENLTDEARMILQYFHSHIREKMATRTTAKTADLCQSEVKKVKRFFKSIRKRHKKTDSHIIASSSLADDVESSAAPPPEQGISQSLVMTKVADMFRKVLGPKH